MHMFVEGTEEDLIWEAYLLHVKAYLQLAKVYNERGNTFESPNENFMRRIEEAAGIPKQSADDVRREIFMRRGLGDFGVRDDFVKAIEKVKNS